MNDFDRFLLSIVVLGSIAAVILWMVFITLGVITGLAS